MSGYLRRLAAHTLGHMPSVHSTARGSTKHRATADQSGIALGSDSAEPSVTEHSGLSSDAAIEHAEPSPARSLEAGVVRHRSPDRERQASDSLRASELDPALAPEGMFDPASTSDEDAPPRSLSVRHLEEAPRGERSPGEVMRDGRPRRGVPEIVGTSREPARSARERPRAIRDVAPAERSVPDVHIHIGRVELVASVPARKMESARVDEKKPMSLDEYFGRRGRRPA